MDSSFHFSQIDQELLSTGTATRLLMASLLGGVVGLEREWRHKASGLRTNMLICLGSSFFTMLSAVLAGESGSNKGQVASNIVQGIGFLGAGLILHSRNRVSGLTSAATVWVVASIGMACGAGLYIEAALATLIVLFALLVIGVLEPMTGRKRIPMLYEVRGSDERAIFLTILSVLDRAHLRLNVVEKSTVADIERVTFEVSAPPKIHQSLLIDLRAAASTDRVSVFQEIEEE